MLSTLLEMSLAGGCLILVVIVLRALLLHRRIDELSEKEAALSPDDSSFFEARAELVSERMRLQEELDGLEKEKKVLRVTPQQLAAGDLPVIGIVPGEIITQNLGRAAAPDPTHDILKIAVAERHHGTGHIGLGYIKGYGLRQGAVATSFAHDSHNIIAVGADDADLAFAINRIAEMQGGTVVVHEGKVIAELPLPVAGLMSDAPLEEVNDLLEQAKAAQGRPTVILARTVKGKGVSFMENNAGWHGKAPNAEQYEQAKAELSSAIAKLEVE